MIRHAAADTGGRLCGRTDVPALADALEAASRSRTLLDGVTRCVSSPALRCRQTAATLWPEFETDSRLAEQDFGDWDGRPHAEVPDLGPMTVYALARHRPPGGESFQDLCARVAPALTELADTGGTIAVVAHAGTVRAALALALGLPAGALAFDVTPLSITRLRRVPDGFAVICVNCPPA